MSINRDIESDWRWFRSGDGNLRAGDSIIVVRNGEAIAVDFRDLQSGIADGLPITGWGAYNDTQYTAESPFSLSADTDTPLPNNAGSVLEGQKPSDIDTFYDGTVITGRSGDGLLITLDFVATPTSVAATSIEVWIDIGGAFGELYRGIVGFPKGTGVDRPINATVGVYTLDTWEANGGTMYVRSDGPVDIHSVRYVLARTHKAVTP